MVDVRLEVCLSRAVRASFADLNNTRRKGAGRGSAHIEVQAIE